MNVLRQMKNRVRAEARDRNERMDEIFAGKDKADFWLDISGVPVNCTPQEIEDTLSDMVPEAERRFFSPTSFLLDYWNRGVVYGLSRQQATIIDCCVDWYNRNNPCSLIDFSPATGEEHTYDFRMPNGGYREAWSRH